MHMIEKYESGKKEKFLHEYFITHKYFCFFNGSTAGDRAMTLKAQK